MNAQQQATLLKIAKLLVDNKQAVLQSFKPKGCCGSGTEPTWVWRDQTCYKLGALLELNESWINDEVSYVQ